MVLTKIVLSENAPYLHLSVPQSLPSFLKKRLCSTERMSSLPTSSSFYHHHHQKQPPKPVEAPRPPTRTAEFGRLSDCGSVTDLALTQDDAYIWMTLMNKWEERTFKTTLVNSLLSLCVSIYEQLCRQQNILNTPPPSPTTKGDAMGELSSFMKCALERSRLTSSCLVLTVFYMALLSTPRPLSHEQSDAVRKLASHSCLQIFLASLLAAHKYTEDVAYYNSSWAELAGIPLATVNGLEKTMLGALGHQLVVSRVQFKRWVAKLARKLHWVDPLPVFAPRPVLDAQSTAAADDRGSAQK